MLHLIYFQIYLGALTVFCSLKDCSEWIIRVKGKLSFMKKWINVQRVERLSKTRLCSILATRHIEQHKFKLNKIKHFKFSSSVTLAHFKCSVAILASIYCIGKCRQGTYSLALKLCFSRLHNFQTHPTCVIFISWLVWFQDSECPQKKPETTPRTKLLSKLLSPSVAEPLISWWPHPKGWYNFKVIVLQFVVTRSYRLAEFSISSLPLL